MPSATGIRFRIQVFHTQVEGIAVYRQAFSFQRIKQVKIGRCIIEFAVILDTGRSAEPYPGGFHQ